MNTLTPIEKKLLVEALEIAEAHHKECGHNTSFAAIRNLRSRLTIPPVVISYGLASALDVVVYLVKAADRALDPLRQELDDRQNSGNDEEFAGLQETVNVLDAAISAARGIAA